MPEFPNLKETGSIAFSFLRNKFRVIFRYVKKLLLLEFSDVDGSAPSKVCNQIPLKKEKVYIWLGLRIPFGPIENRKIKLISVPSIGNVHIPLDTHRSPSR